MFDIQRREFFHWGAQGLGATALLSLLQRDGLLQASTPGGTARAKRAIHICLIGGMSHVDSFDYKPQLAKYHGKALGASEKPDIFFGQVGLLRQHDWEFQQRG